MRGFFYFITCLLFLTSQFALCYEMGPYFMLGVSPLYASTSLKNQNIDYTSAYQGNSGQLRVGYGLYYVSLHAVYESGESENTNTGAKEERKDSFYGIGAMIHPLNNFYAGVTATSGTVELINTANSAYSFKLSGSRTVGNVGMKFPGSNGIRYHIEYYKILDGQYDEVDGETLGVIVEEEGSGVTFGASKRF